MDDKLQAILDAMPEPTPVDSVPKLVRALIYGDPGFGKTTLAAKIIDVLGGRACMISTDSAWTVIGNYPEIAEKIDVYPYKNLSQLRAIALANIEGIEPWASYDTLLWDTASHGIDNTLRDLTDQMTYDPKQQPAPGVEGWPQYRIVDRYLADAIKALNKSGMNIIYTAHLRDPSDKDREKLKLAKRPAMPEACFKKIAQEVNLLGWLTKSVSGGTVTRKVQLSGTNTETAKSQIPTIPEATYPVDQIPDLIAKWRTQ